MILISFSGHDRARPIGRDLQEAQTNKRKGPHAAKKAKKTKNAGKGPAKAKSTTGKRKSTASDFACAGAAEVVLGACM